MRFLVKLLAILLSSVACLSQQAETESLLPSVRSRRNWKLLFSDSCAIFGRAWGVTVFGVLLCGCDYIIG